MGSFLFYIFEVALSLLLFYLVFRLFFKADTLFRTNRFLLLFGTVGCMWLPTMQLDVPHAELWQRPISSVRSLLVKDETAVSESLQPAVQRTMLATPEAGAAVNAQLSEALPDRFRSTLSWSLAIGVIYLTGAGTVLCFLLLSTWQMLRFIRHYAGYEYEGFHLIIYPGPIVSFSWRNTIVLSQEDYEKHAPEILLHEQMHSHYRHTLDLLWMEVLLVLQWFNPAVWLLMRDLREIHEFEADNGVLTRGVDATQYQLLLVKKSVGTRLYSMANGFNHSKLKNRINMMLKKRTSNWARLKLLLLVPVAVATMYAFAQPEVKKTVEQVVKPESVVQDSLGQGDTWDLLEQYFERKRKDVWGESEPTKVKERDVHHLFVNLNNQILLDNEYLKTGDEDKNVDFLRSQLTSLLKKDYEQAVREKRPFSSIIAVRYDRGSQAGAMKSYLTTIKEVYLQLRQEIAARQGGATEEQLDQIFPILVQFMNPQTFGEIPSKDRNTPLPVEIRLYHSSGSEVITLKDISLNQLEKEIAACKKRIPDGWSISLKVDSNMQVGMIQDVKEVIRKAYIKNLTYVTQ